MDQTLKCSLYSNEHRSSQETTLSESHKDEPTILLSAALVSSDTDAKRTEKGDQYNADDKKETNDKGLHSDSKETKHTTTLAGSASCECSDDTTIARKSCDSGIVSMEQTSKRSSEESFASSSSSTVASSHRNCLGVVLPAMKEAAQKISEETMDNNSNLAFDSNALKKNVELDLSRDNSIYKQSTNTKGIQANLLDAREQEEADEPVREGIRYMFDNKFMKAKAIFQSKADVEPLHALALGFIAFLKAIMTYNDNDVEIAMNALSRAYSMTKTQIELISDKRPLKDSFSQYFSNLASTNTTTTAALAPGISMTPLETFGDKESFIPNGILRAHIIKAESCLLMSLLQMAQENMTNYLKCGLNLRRAYKDYTIVWEEYKRMGQAYTKYMDRETVSAVQFGIGSVQLILASLPYKAHKLISSFGWKGDKQLGIALLKLSLEGRGIHAPLASLMLLTYYSVLSSHVSQLYGSDLFRSVLDCLLDAQKNHPNSCFFLYYAAHTARVAKNIPLSTQSYEFAAELSQGEWVEVEIKQTTAYEVGLNHALQLNWHESAGCFEQLSRENYWSPGFCKYFAGACYEMLGQRTDAILAFAEVPQIVNESQINFQQNGRNKGLMDDYVMKKVAQCQKKGYQDMDLSLPALEFLLVWNMFKDMENSQLEACLSMVEVTLDAIYEREKMEYTVRLRELVPVTSPPDYYVQRAVLLLTKTSILNALGRYNDGITHLNWILDHKHCLTSESWVIPFAYWEAGVTSWGLGNLTKSRQVWQQALTCAHYDFEYRLVIQLSLALNRCDQVGVAKVVPKAKKKNTSLTTNGRKRMPIVTK